MSNHNIIHKTYAILSLCIILCFVLSTQNLRGQEQQPTFDSSNLDAFNVTVRIKDVGTYIFPALYEDPDGLYLPVDALFNLLKIVNTISDEGKVIKGYFEDPANSFEINAVKRFITYKDKTVPMDSSEAVLDMGTLYLKKTAFLKGFGFKMSLNFRALTADFESEFELPVVKLLKQEKLREKVGGKQGDEALYDTIIKRDYHLLKGAMVDWSVASNQSKSYNSETRVELGLGTEFLGGETNLFLNWSSEYGMNRRQQQYSWRWANNSSSLLRQVQVGRVSSRSIATLLSPLDGFYITNSPTTVRKALGEYVISDVTEPDWVVELYINNVLISYTRTDASGFYTFTIPIVYGTSRITLRFYGPGGEIRSEEKTLSMPYNMLPKGEVEYKMTGGALMDSTFAMFGRAEVGFGIARWLTASVGTEYLTSIDESPMIPFVNFTLQPISKVLIIGEYAHNVRWKGTLNMTLPLKANLELNYSKYTPGQKAIIYNYLEERSGSVSLPYRFNFLSGYTKLSVRQNLYSNYSYNSGEYMFSTNYKNLSMNFSNFLNWTPEGNNNMYGNLALGIKINKTFNFRPSVQYNYTTSSLISIKGELESRINEVSHIAFRYENNLLSRSHGFNLMFRYELPFASTSVSGGYSNRSVQASESVRGSFAFGSGKKYVLADNRGTVGRTGISVESFVDINFNGIKDKGEPSTERIKVRCSGGVVVNNNKDSIVRVTGLEPFVEYTLIFDETSFENLTWKLQYKNMLVTTNPNQFKKVYVPVQPMAEISGMVADENGKALGRILVVFKDKYGKKVAQTISESDGYFSFIGFNPGDYEVGIDSMQLQILKKLSEPVMVTVKPDVDGDIVDAGTLVWKEMVKPVEKAEKAESAETVKPVEVTKVKEVVKPVEEVKPIEIAKPKEIAKPVEVAKQAEIIKKTDINKAIEVVRKVDSTVKVVKIVPISLEIAVVHYSNKTYSLQLGAFLSEVQAHSLIDKVNAVMTDVELHYEHENNYYKVRTPMVSTRGEAVKLARRIQALGLLK